MTYFQRMAAIEGRFYEIWKDMSLNDSLSPLERSKLAVWDYPVSDKYTKMWQAIQEAGMPNTLEEAVERVRNSTSNTGKLDLQFLSCVGASSIVSKYKISYPTIQKFHKGFIFYLKPCFCSVSFRVPLTFQQSRISYNSIFDLQI